MCIRDRRYWEVYYNLDFSHDSRYFEERLRELMADSVKVHLGADVPVGAYLSGGLDSSIVAAVAAEQQGPGLKAFLGKFAEGPEYDESRYAQALSEANGIDLHELEITADDFIENARK